MDFGINFANMQGQKEEVKKMRLPRMMGNSQYPFDEKWKQMEVGLRGVLSLHGEIKWMDLYT